MNCLKGHIKEINVEGKLSLVSVDLGTYICSAIVIETPETASYLKIDNPVKLLFKETEVIIAKGEALEISLQNRILGRVQSIESGALLSRLVIASEVGEIVSIITSNAVKQLKLEEGTEVTAMIKTNEVMLEE